MFSSVSSRSLDWPAIAWPKKARRAHDGHPDEPIEFVGRGVVRIDYKMPQFQTGFQEWVGEIILIEADLLVVVTMFNHRSCLLP